MPKKKTTDVGGWVADFAAVSLQDTNSFCFPRCEYRTRFQGGSHFAMTHQDFWGTYFRSTANGGNSDRYSKLKKTQEGSVINVSSAALLAKKLGAYHSKIGAFNSPFYHKEYKGILSIAPAIRRASNDFLYDDILIYKQKMCEILVSRLSDKVGLSIKAGYYNDYPCVMVNIPEFATKGSTESWYEMAMAYFVAIANKNACTNLVPIEMVIRSSFGHNAPSVAATGASFRINIGLVPQKYAKILANSLVELSGVIDTLKGTEIEQSLVDGVNVKIKKYNEGKDKKIERWGATKLFDILNTKGDVGGKKVILQILRMKKYADLLTNYITEEFQKDNAHRQLARPLVRMLEHLDYGKTISLKSPDDVYHLQKMAFSGDQDGVILEDREFWNLVTRVLKALGIEMDEVSLHGLHALLEKANLEFVKNSSYQEAEDGIGSDSECEVEAEVEKLFSKKVTVATGMRAINLATFLGLYAIKRLGAAEYSVDTSNMYYETSDAIKLVVDPFELLLGDELVLKLIKTARSKLVFFDLTHCETDGRLQAELGEINENSVVILDYTSAITKKIDEFVKKCMQKTSLVILVSSGLKNEQAGADMNPYGTFRIITRDPKFLDELYGLSKHVLRDENFPAAAHQVRKSYKEAGFVVTNGKIFGKKAKYAKKTVTEYNVESGVSEEFCQFFTHQEQIAQLHLMVVAWEDIVRLYRQGSLQIIYDLFARFESNIERLLGYGCNVCEISSWPEEKTKLLGSERVYEILGSDNDDEFDEIEDCYEQSASITRAMIERDFLPDKKFSTIFEEIKSEPDVDDCLDRIEVEEEVDGCPEGWCADQSEEENYPGWEDEGDCPDSESSGSLSGSRLSSRCSSIESFYLV